MPGTFSPPPTSKETANQRSRHASRHMRHARAVIHVGISNPRRQGKRSRHPRRMYNPQFYVSGKRPMISSVYSISELGNCMNCWYTSMFPKINSACYLWYQIDTASPANPGHSHKRPAPHIAPGFVRTAGRTQLRRKIKTPGSRENDLNQWEKTLHM